MKMKSVLEGRPALAAVIDQVAEVAGYLWQKGWAERNGGNITVNVTDLVDDEIKALPAIAPARPIGKILPNLKGTYFYAKGTGKRMRDLARRPMENGAIIRVCDDCASYEIIADNAVLWSMIPETLAFAPLGIGVVPYAMPGSLELADATLEQIKTHDVVLWEKHGTTSVGIDIMDAFDQTDVLCKSAHIYMCARSMGSEPDGMTEEAVKAVQETFHLPKSRPC